VRAVVGAAVPIVITLDLHGVVTPRMCRAINGLAALHTYPHIDGGDTGRRAAAVLCRLMDGDLSAPTLARVRIPMLLRGNEQPRATLSLYTAVGCHWRPAIT
jgi:microcystin degradation protein MlrC